MFIDFRERGRRGEDEESKRERDRNIHMREKPQLVALYTCCNWELNLQPFGVWDNAKTN